MGIIIHQQVNCGESGYLADASGLKAKKGWLVRSVEVLVPGRPSYARGVVICFGHGGKWQVLDQIATPGSTFFRRLRDSNKEPLHVERLGALWVQARLAKDGPAITEPLIVANFELEAR